MVKPPRALRLGLIVIASAALGYWSYDRYFVDHEPEEVEIDSLRVEKLRVEQFEVIDPWDDEQREQ